MLRKQFSLLVIGDPSGLADYDVHKEVEPYVQYYFSNRGKLRETAISAIDILLKDKALPEVVKNGLKIRRNTIDHMTDFEYYQVITEGMDYDENGNALSTLNPNGKWVKCEPDTKNLCPLILKDSGDKVQSAKACDVDWEAMANKEREVLYQHTWELCVEKREPENEVEKQILTNMSNYEGYFDDFASKEEYVAYSTAFFTSAVLINGEWDDSTEYDSKDWVLNYYDRFIKDLNGGETVSMYVFETNDDQQERDN